jgi:RND family efflux transporter MFP subunit
MEKLLFSILTIFLFAASCKNPGEQTRPIEEKITESVYASGIIKSNNQYQVFPMVNGIITNVFVSEGDLVKKGQKLFQLKDVTARLSTESAQIAAEYSTINANRDKLNQLKIEIDAAKDKMENEASLLAKQKNLWEQGIGSRNDLEQRELSAKLAAKAYNTALLRYNDLEKQLSLEEKQSRKNLQISNVSTADFIIKSQLNGKVYNVLKEAGEMVNTQSPVAIIGDAAGFIIELQVDEYDITRVKVGQKVLLSMDSYKGEVFIAVVTKIDPIMNEQTKTFKVEAAFVGPPPTLYPNLTAEANIVIKVKEKALTIPRSYLIDDNYVMLSNKEKRKVIVGMKDYEKAEIVGGLTKDDVILKP